MHDNVYSAVVMAEPLREFTRPSGCQPQSKPNDLGYQSACRLPESTPTIAIDVLWTVGSFPRFFLKPNV